MSDDWVNDPYDEAPIHVLDDDGEPDGEPDDEPGRAAGLGETVEPDDASAAG